MPHLGIAFKIMSTVDKFKIMSTVDKFKIMSTVDKFKDNPIFSLAVGQLKFEGSGDPRTLTSHQFFTLKLEFFLQKNNHIFFRYFTSFGFLPYLHANNFSDVLFSLNDSISVLNV